MEELFEAGLIKVVFATETLSLGINMPAKTVVIEDLWKFQGERHELVTPGEYTQLTGRAGRRGIDALGHAVVVYQRQVPFERVAGLAATRTYDLTSSFRPSYNMAVNLVRNYTPRAGAPDAEQLVRAVPRRPRGGRARTVQEARPRGADGLPREPRSATEGTSTSTGLCARSARELRADDRRGTEADAATRRPGGASARFSPGDVIAVPQAREAADASAVVLAVREGRPTVLTDDRSFFRLGGARLRRAAAALTRIAACRARARRRSARYRRDVAATLTALHVRPPRRGAAHAGDPAVERRGGALDAEARAHPCHACPDRRDARAVGRSARTSSTQQIAGVDRRIKLRTETLARRFDRVLGVLGELGYVDGWTLTDKGGGSPGSTARATCWWGRRSPPACSTG